jgi:pectate lyase-like protein/parallel beta helix pectate lyase-like protein
MRYAMLLTAATLLAIAGCRDDSQQSATLQTTPTIDLVNDLGAAADGVTDDEPVLQQALDAAAAKGGGTVYLPEGVYGIGAPLILRSGVRLVGDGQGKTVLRTLVRSIGKTIDETGVWAAVAMVSANGASIADLTIDLSFAATEANGIAILPLGSTFEGAPSVDCEVAGVEVIGGGNYHAYMIWNLRGRDIRIINNVVDGRVDSRVASNQEGIESYGGADVLIAWNTIRNIGNSGLNFGSAGAPDTGIERLEVLQNTVTNAGRGLNIGTWMGSDGNPQNIDDVRIEGNTFSDLWNTGLYISPQPGTQISDLVVVDNTIREVGSADTVAAVGIHFQGTPATSTLPAGAATGNVASSNRIIAIRGANGIGVAVIQYPNVQLLENRISGTNDAGVHAFGSRNLLVAHNTISNAALNAVGSHGPESSVYVRNNIFTDWGAGRQLPGVAVDQAVEGDVRDNEFVQSGFTGAAVRVEATAANIIVFGNRLVSSPVTGSTFVNLGAGSNLGSFVAQAGVMTMSVPHPLASPQSRVIVEQMSGTALSVSVVPSAGSLQFAFSSAPRGAEEFRFEIDPAIDAASAQTSL